MKSQTIVYTFAASLLLLTLIKLASTVSSPTASAGGPWEIQAGGELPGAPEVPPLPFSPYGSVKINGANISLDTPVSGWCQGEKYAETLPVFNQGETWYQLNIKGDDPDTGEVEGCTNGETVNFYIGPHQADQSASWAEGSAPQIDLSVLLPADTPTPTPTGTAEPTAEGVRFYLPLLQNK